MATDSPACAPMIASNAGHARARRSGTLSPSGNGNSPTRAIQSANAAGSLPRISSAVRPSQRPIAISRSAGITVGVSPCGAAMISAVRRAGAEEPGAAEPGPDEGQGRYQSDGRRARAQAAAEGGTVTLDLRRPKAPGQERRRRARERRHHQEGPPAEAGRELSHRGDLEEQEEDQPDRAKGADTAVAHDAEPVLGVSAHEPIEAVGEAVEVEAAGEDLPRGHREERGEERREENARHALDADQDDPEAEPDDRKPARRAPERVHAVRRAPRQRHDRQVAHGEDEARHVTRLTR